MPFWPFDHRELVNAGSPADGALAAEADDHAIFHPEDGEEQPAFEPILALWNDMRRGRAMPARADIAARDMKPYLRQVQLYEVIDGGRDFRIRLVGTDFTESMGYDPTGQCVSQLEDPFLRERTFAAARQVLETRGPLRTSASFRAVARVIYRRIEKIWLPLGDDTGITHILCQAIRVDRTAYAAD